MTVEEGKSLELHQLRCFVAAAEELHFGRAAQRLQMMPSALGRHIKLLEEDLGVRLFARTPRARRSRMGASDSAAAGLLPPLLRDLRVAHPDVAVQLLEEKTIRLLPKL